MTMMTMADCQVFLLSRADVHRCTAVVLGDCMTLLVTIKHLQKYTIEHNGMRNFNIYEIVKDTIKCV